MNVGDTVICQHNDWFNAYGAVKVSIGLGTRAKIRQTRMIAGAKFIYLENFDEDCCFLASGFKAIKSLN
jgi:hypothetical protein